MHTSIIYGFFKVDIYKPNNDYINICIYVFIYVFMCLFKLLNAIFAFLIHCLFAAFIDVHCVPLLHSNLYHSVHKVSVLLLENSSSIISSMCLVLCLN